MSFIKEMKHVDFMFNLTHYRIAHAGLHGQRYLARYKEEVGHPAE